MKSVVSHVGQNQYEWTFNDDGSLLCNGRGMNIELRPVSMNRVSVLADGRSFDAVVYRNDSKFEVFMNGTLWSVEVEAAMRNGAWQLLKPAILKPAGVEVRSPMPGMVVRCEVRSGSRVKSGDGLLVLEAMKMENEIRATVGGTVKKVMVIEKQVVDKGELLLLIE